MAGLPDLGTILGVILAGMGAVAVWFFRLWQGAKEREAEQRRQLEQSEAARKAEREARKLADEERRKTNDAVQETKQKVRQREKRDFGVNK